MSWGSIVFFGQDGSVVEQIRYQNGWGMSPVLWEVAFNEARSVGRTTHGSWLFWLVEIPHDPHLRWAAELPPTARNLILMTHMEPTAVAREHWPEVIRYLWYALDSFAHHHIHDDAVNHWPAIIEELTRRQDDTNILAFGIYTTSINDYPFHGKRHPEDEALDEPFDVRKDSWWFTPGPEPTRAPPEFGPDVTPRPAPESKTAKDYPGTKKAAEGG